MRAVAKIWLFPLALCLAWTAARATQVEVDPLQSRLGFSLQTRWGQTLEGRFPQYEGEIVTMEGGRHRVQLRLDSGSVEIADSPRYSRYARGPRFFDAEDHPKIEFVSEPYDQALLRHGGELGGRLTIRGVTRREVFTIAPSACERPGYDCDVVARGSVRRENYGINGFGLAIHNRVHFFLNVRVRDEPAS
nr:YceI family protein [Luteimonas galliterrae]